LITLDGTGIFSTLLTGYGLDANADLSQITTVGANTIFTAAFVTNSTFNGDLGLVNNIDVDTGNTVTFSGANITKLDTTVHSFSNAGNVIVNLGNAGSNVDFSNIDRALYSHTGSFTINGGVGSDTIGGSLGNDTIDFKADVATDTFNFSVANNGEGRDTILNFNASQDKIHLTDVASGIANANIISYINNEIAAGHIVQNGANTDINFNAGETITLVGVSVGTITAADFTGI
jgi:hypothetical protein